jgi:DNA-binding response OmpR family regulator
MLSYGYTTLLVLLMSNLGVVFSRREILDRIYGDHLSCTVRAIDTQIHGLRKKLGSAVVGREAIRGVGYRFVDRSTESA